MKKKSVLDIKYVSIFSTPFAPKILCYHKYSVSYATDLCRNTCKSSMSVSYYSLILTETGTLSAELIHLQSHKAPELLHVDKKMDEQTY